MNQRWLIRLAAMALLLPVLHTPARATPGGPLSCVEGHYNEGGCPPYANIDFTDGAGNVNMFEYDQPTLALGRTLPLSEVQGSVHLDQGKLAVKARHSGDDDPSNGAAARLTATAVDVFTLHSTTALPPGQDFINIVAKVSAQGVGSIDRDYNVVQSLLHLGFGGGVVAYGGGVLDRGSVIQSVSHWPTFQQFVVPLEVYANITVRVGVPFELNYSLLAIVTEASFLDFDSFSGLAHPAQLSFSLPAGSGFSISSIGGYDSLTAVPEPVTALLWVGGLALVVGAARRRRLLAAAALCAAAPAAWAFGGVGGMPECASFTSCTAAVGSSASWQVRNELTNITAGFIVPSDLAPGTTVYSGTDSIATTAVLVQGNGFPIPGASGEFHRAAGAKAQSDFALDRVQTSMGHGVSGVLARGSGTASLSLRTFAFAASAWRDVWSFSGAGHLSAVVVLDGQSSLGPIGTFQPSFEFSPNSAYADWYYDLRVWDVTHFSVSDDFELGGPTPVARAKISGNNEQRPSFASNLALEFDFASATQYVITAELIATSYDGRQIDLFNTARLQNVGVSGGASMSTLSGHNFLNPVPEPQPAALMAAGALALLLWCRRRVA